MRSKQIAAVVMGALIALAAAGWSHNLARAQAADVASVDAAFKRAFLAGDLNALGALFDDNAVETAPFGAFKGKDAIRTATQGFVAGNPGLSISFSDTVIELDTAIHRIAIASDSIRMAGVSRIWVIHTIVVLQGKIVSLAAVPDLSDAETLKFAQSGRTGG